MVQIYQRNLNGRLDETGASFCNHMIAIGMGLRALIRNTDQQNAQPHSNAHTPSVHLKLEMTVGKFDLVGMKPVDFRTKLGINNKSAGEKTFKFSGYRI